MAKPKVTLVKKSALRGAVPKKTGTIVDFQIQDNQNDSCTVIGVDGAGNQVALPSTVSIVVTSSDPTTITVAAPVGTTFVMTATGKLTIPGTPTNLTVTATWSDGSAGPYTYILPVDVIAGPVGGIVIVPGTPTINP
jgi:hypothetical protein